MSNLIPGIGILVAIPLNALPALHSHYMGFEDPYGFNAEDGEGHKSERLFWIEHKDSDQMLSKMGESNFFSFHRVFLSYYEAFTKLNYFWDHQIPEKIKDKQDKITMHEIVTELDNHELKLTSSEALTYAKYIHTGNPKKPKIFIEPNPFQEYLWATHSAELLKSFQLTSFTHPSIREESIFHSPYLFKGAVLKKEISAVLYELASLQSYTQGDFIKKISNILEIIEKNVNRNKERYTQLSGKLYVNNLVDLLINEVSKAKRQYFYGIFNAANLLDPYSRHGSDEIKKINGINVQKDIDYKKILNDWKDDNLLPSDENFMKVFKIWYFTTIYLAVNWLRLPHFDKR